MVQKTLMGDDIPELVSINFAERYYKLDKPYFTTIRGKTHPKRKKIETGDCVEITLKRCHLCYAKVKKIRYNRIGEIPLEILKLDAQYPGLVIEEYFDFIRLLKKYWPYQEVNAETKVSIYELEMVNIND